MAETILMPRQGNTVESCILIRWRIREGDPVEPKTIVADVETDKASFEIEAGFAGSVLKRLCAEGDDVPVMQPIAIIGQLGEDISGLEVLRSAEPSGTQDAPPQEDREVPVHRPPRQAPNGASFASPRAQTLARGHHINATTLEGTGPEGRVIERDVAKALDNRPPGTGPGGRLLASDAMAADDVPFTEAKIRGIRKVIADRMLESLATTAQFTLNSSALAVRLQELRSRFKASDPDLSLQGVTIGDLIVYAVSRTLKSHRVLNAHLVGDSLREFQDIHLGIACDTPRGLMVPVIRHADRLSLKQISDETKRLAKACRTGSILPDELTGSTFSISNLGAQGVESFTPVLNVPEVAILGICTIAPKPVQRGNEVVFLPAVGLSLTINHMVVDGAPAAVFLKALGQAIAEIDLVLAL